jgi:Lon protease-like protein
MSSWDSPDSGPFFSGTAPLFPLPNAALFPNVMLPLHIFEPRYRCMIEDVLKADRVLAIALLKDGWEPHYESKECSIHPTVCLAKIVAEERLDDGRFHLLTQGLCRAKLTGEQQTDLPYRIGNVEVIEDEYPLPPVIDRIRRQQELVSAFRQIFPNLDMDADLLSTMEEEVPLGELCDVIAHALRLDPFHAHRLLEQSDVDQRSDLVLQLLKLQCRKPILPTGQRTFPPGFSLN